MRPASTLPPPKKAALQEQYESWETTYEDRIISRLEQRRQNETYWFFPEFPPGQTPRSKNTVAAFPLDKELQKKIYNELLKAGYRITFYQPGDKVTLLSGELFPEGKESGFIIELTEEPLTF